MEENKPASGGQAQGEKEFILDFSKFGSLGGNLNKKYVVYGILVIILLLSAYLRYVPVNTYPPTAPLGAADNWWAYRHSKEILDHGYPGTAAVGPEVYGIGGCSPRIVCLLTGNKEYWDYLHDAPTGGSAPVDLYHYFNAYSYKYFFRLIFSSFIKYIQFVPIIFSTLAVLSMFLLTREGFGEKAGLAAAFIFGLSVPFFQRSVIGQPDDDAVIIFFTIFLAFLFFRAWNRKSFKWAAIGGIAMSAFAWVWPGGYGNIPFLLIIAGVIYYSYKLLMMNFGETGHLLELKNYYFVLIGILAAALYLSYSKSFPIMLTMILGAMLFGAAFVIPAITLALHHHSRLREKFSSFPNIRALISDSIKWIYGFVRGKTSGYNEEWLGISVIASFILIGVFLTWLLINSFTANIFGLVQHFLTVRTIQRAPIGAGQTSVIRNVFLTVAEFNPASSRTILFSAHIAPIFLAVTSLLLLPFGLIKKLREKFYFIVFILIWLTTTFYASLNGVRFIEYFTIPLAVLASIIASTYDIYNKPNKESMRTMLVFGTAILILAVLLLMPNISAVQGQPQFGPAYIPQTFSLSHQVGGGEGKNWLDFYKWANQNTPEGTIFASWWDPGHGFTALAQRPIVADGSQNHNHVHDLAVAFTTTNETQALELMKKYNISYFFTSTDLISKYGAISFLASGTGDNYQFLTADRNQVVQSKDGSILVPYPLNVQTSNGDLKTTVALTLRNNFTESSTSWIIGNQPAKTIARTVFFDQSGKGYLKNATSNDTIDMMLYSYPGYGNAIFLPPHLERNTLTQLHLFNGAGVAGHFQLVQNFGDEIKVFKVIY